MTRRGLEQRERKGGLTLCALDRRMEVRMRFDIEQWRCDTNLGKSVTHLKCGESAVTWK